MAASVYYVKGTADENRVTAVFPDPAFVINEVDFPSDRTDGDLMLRDVLEQARAEGGAGSVVFVQKLTPAGAASAQTFASGVQQNGTDPRVIIDPNFAAIDVPRGRLDEMISELSRGLRVFSGYSPTEAKCMTVNRNLLVIMAFIILAVLLVVGMRVRTPGNGVLLALAGFALFVFVISFST